MWGSAGAASEAAARPPSSRWILGGWQDLALVVATPLLVFGGIEWAEGRWTGAQITQFVMVWAFGHHLPGMMRAYGDPELFARFRTRFVAAPVALILICVGSTVYGHPGVFVVGAVWGWWHYLMQTYGFLRIYDSKAGSVDGSTRVLDKAMCLAWFAAPLLLQPSDLTDLLRHAHAAGWPLARMISLETLQTIVAAAVTCVTGSFLIETARQWSRGRRPSALKLALMASTFSFYWYSVTTIENLLVAYALFELFHDVQYLTIVWVFNRGRSQQGAKLPAFTRFLFQPRVSRIGAYLGLIVAYGLLERGTRLGSGDSMRSVWEGVFVASTLLHYYYDGFIWKLREGSVRQPLEIQAAVGREPSRLMRGWRHALLWSLFVIPLVVLSWYR